MSSRGNGRLTSLLWSGADGLSMGRMLAAGALAWLAYSALQLAVNGAVLDEVVVPAQIIAGTTVYPHGHPHLVFYPTVFSLSNFLGAAQLWISENPLALSAFRNVIFLFLSAFVPFAFALLLTGKPKWGHLAGTLVLAESTMRLSGVYPMWIFPSFYSHGHIGLYAALLAAGLVLARCWRMGGLLLGLLPGLHAALALLGWGWAACFLIMQRRNLSLEARRRLLGFGAAGLAVCGVVFLLTLGFRASPPFPPPYDGSLDGKLVYESFLRLDVHRQFSWLPLGYVVNPLALLAVTCLLLFSSSASQNQGESEGEHRVALRWTMVLAGLAWGIVMAGLLGRWAFGELPRLVEVLMPLRFSNALVVLLVPLVVALAARSLQVMAKPVAHASELFLATFVATSGLLRLLEGGSIAGLYPGRVAGTFLFALLGVVLALYMYTCRGVRPRLLAGVAAAILLLVGLLSAWQVTHGAVIFAVTLIATWLLLAVTGMRIASLDSTPRLGIAANVGLPAACLFAALAFLPGHNMDPWNRAVERWDTIKPFDVQLSAWLKSNASPNEFMLGPIFPRPQIQSKTGHPVLMEMETLYLMSYMPNLSSSIGTMAKDLYGVDFTDPDQMARVQADPGPLVESTYWASQWRTRSREQWQALGKTYKFRLVLAVSGVPLDLPVALPGEEYTLYLIP